MKLLLKTQEKNLQVLIIVIIVELLSSISKIQSIKGEIYKLDSIKTKDFGDQHTGIMA